MADTLFEIEDRWQEEWKDMPEFNMQRIKPVLVIKMNFRTEADIKAFEELTGIKITPKVRTYWYPKLNFKTDSEQVYTDEP